MPLTGFQPRPDVTLAPLTPDCAQRMFRWACDPEIARNIGLSHTPSLNKTRTWIEQSVSDDSIVAFAILHAGTHVGNVILDRMNTWLRSSRLSIYIGEASSRGCGVGSSAVHLACEHGFTASVQNKIWLTVHTENSAAIASYQRIGFQIEGTLRQEFLLDGDLVDVHYMGLLSGDFKRAQR